MVTDMKQNTRGSTRILTKMTMLKTFFTSNTYSIQPNISTFANSFDQGLHCLITERSVKMNKTNQTLKIEMDTYVRRICSFNVVIKNTAYFI